MTITPHRFFPKLSKRYLEMGLLPFYESYVKQPIGDSFLSAIRGDYLIERVHREKKIDWSYGGYAEDRAFIPQAFIDYHRQPFHYGIDWNVPPGSVIHLPVNTKVIKKLVLPDWGPLIFAQFADQVVLLSHLDPSYLPDDDVEVAADQPLVRAGLPNVNGYWFTHIHMQVMSLSFYQQLQAQNFAHIPDYAERHECEKFAALFPDPLQVFAKLACVQ